MMMIAALYQHNERILARFFPSLMLAFVLSNCSLIEQQPLSMVPRYSKVIVYFSTENQRLDADADADRMFSF